MAKRWSRAVGRAPTRLRQSRGTRRPASTRRTSVGRVGRVGPVS
jgi:hypothetical protein